MLRWISQLVKARPKLVIAVLLGFMVIAGAIGGGVINHLTSQGFDDPNSQSYKADQLLSKNFVKQEGKIILLVTAKDRNVDSAASSAAGKAIVKELAHTKYLEDVTSYWSGDQPASMKARHNGSALIVGTITGSEDEVSEHIETIGPKFTRENNTVTVGVGGEAEIDRQFALQIEKDLKFAEIIAFPVTAVLLLIVFRSVVAALLPLLIGAFAVMGTLFMLFVLTKFTDVSVYALNLTVMMGLGLAIDYSLFIVSRFREQLAKGDSVDKAIDHTLQKAGRTVAFSALTAAVSLAGLLVFPQIFLRSFAYAGIAVAVVAAIGALLLLPAILKVLGKRINALPIGKRQTFEHDSKLWRHISMIVMRRPVWVTSGVLILLIVLGSPFWSLNPGRSDERSLPEDNSVRLVQQTINRDYETAGSSPIRVVSSDTTGVTDQNIDRYAQSLSKLKHVDRIEAASGVYVKGHQVAPPLSHPEYKSGQHTWLAVIPETVPPFSKEAQKLVEEVRATSSPFESQAGGLSATLVDLKSSLAKHLPFAIAIIMAAMFLLFFLAFGSLFLPFKAIVTAVLSLTASFGAMVWIFQDGHLSGLLNFTPTGMIEATMPVLMFCIAFGLSMDYEMFLLSRIKEAYDDTKDNMKAVAIGLEKTGGIVTAAALSISVIFFAFATSGVTLIKMLGLGLAIAVLLDAFVIRATLVPALMRLAGNLNWWAPKPLKKLYKRFGFTKV